MKFKVKAAKYSNLRNEKYVIFESIVEDNRQVESGFWSDDGVIRDLQEALLFESYEDAKQAVKQQIQVHNDNAPQDYNSEHTYDIIKVSIEVEEEGVVDTLTFKR